MAEKRSKRMTLVLDLALAAEKQAAKNLGAAQFELAAEKQRLRELRAYYESYQGQFDKQTTRLQVRDLANSRAFLAKLDEACALQASQLRNSEQKVHLAREQWRSSHLKSDALSTYQSKIATEEQRSEDRIEQKALDDLITQRRPRV